MYTADGAPSGFASLCGFTAARAAWQKRQCGIASLATLSLDLAALQSPVATCIGNQYNVAKSVTWIAVPSSCPHGAAGSSVSQRRWATILGLSKLHPLFFFLFLSGQHVDIWANQMISICLCQSAQILELAVPICTCMLCSAPAFIVAVLSSPPTPFHRWPICLEI